MRTKSGGWYSYASTIINVRISYPDAVIAEATDVGWPASPSATAPVEPSTADASRPRNSSRKLGRRD
jgi:hypothetical protein